MKYVNKTFYAINKMFFIDSTYIFFTFIFYNIFNRMVLTLFYLLRYNLNKTEEIC